MRQRPNHTSQGLIFVGVCVLLAAVLFFAVRLGRVPDRAAGPGNEVAMAVENTYQPDIDAVDAEPIDQGAPITYEDGEIGQGAEEPPLEAAPASEGGGAAGGEGQLPQGGTPAVAGACTGRWSDRQRGGVEVSFGVSPANVPVFEWRYGNQTIVNRRYDPTTNPVRLQVGPDELYYMTCNGGQGEITPFGQPDQSSWAMYRAP